MSFSALSGLRVLVLEDEFLIAMDVEQTCRDHGASDVLIRRSLAEIGEAIWSEAFDVAVVDLMLGGESTVGFARELRDRSVPFIFASGYADVDLLNAEFPGIPVIGKPYAEATLVESIRAVAAR